MCDHRQNQRDECPIVPDKVEVTPLRDIQCPAHPRGRKFLLLDLPYGQVYLLSVIFVVVDYITGVMCATIDKKLSSEVGFKGIFKKVLAV